MRILFAGTPEFAAAHLRYLLDHSPHNVVGVFTQPDRPAGRGKQVTASPVKCLALEHRLPLFQPLTLRDAATQQQISSLAPDVMIVVAYGLILPKAVLQIPRHGCLNVHASLLPRWRGAAPIQRAIEAGDAESGITIMQMDEGLDTGDMLLRLACPISTGETGSSLHDKLLALGGPALVTVLEQIGQAKTHAEKQAGDQACYAAKISKQEARLDWQLDAQTLERKIRAFNPFPIAFFEINGQPVRVWCATFSPVKTLAAPGSILKADKEGIDVATGNGVLRLEKLQLPGKKILAASELLNGHASLFHPGTQLN